MLRRLSIENIALIDRLDIEFGPGFNVLSGETGAGKSIIIDAVNFVLGERSGKDLIKHGASKARVDALFDIDKNDKVTNELEKQGIGCDDGALLLSREVTQSGRNTCRVNGTLCVIATLKHISDLLVDIHGQNEHQSLLFPAKHMGFLDAFAGEETKTLLDRVNATYDAISALKKERLGDFDDEGGREREMDMLRFQIKEIARGSIREGEEAELLAEREILANAERIARAIDGAHALVSGDDGSALDNLAGADKLLRDISGFSPDYESVSARVQELYYSLEDVASTLRDMTGTLEFDPARYDEIERRLDVIGDLKRKYGGDEAAVLAFAEKAKARLESLEHAGERMEQLDNQLREASAKYASEAEKLTTSRKSAAKKLEKLILEQLGDLGLGKSHFEVSFTRPENAAPRRGGLDDVEFLLSTNPGEPLKPLAKVASGGELARIMLAFKAVFAECDDMDTLIFDEIDTGISGATAVVVGGKMTDIARVRQVICVTHLPQIAALADEHLLIEKHDDGVTTTVSAAPLDMQGKIKRIAQMMDGSSESALALEHAKSFIENASRRKGGE